MTKFMDIVWVCLGVLCAGEYATGERNGKVGVRLGVRIADDARIEFDKQNKAVINRTVVVRELS
mgnify:CR=1 FL=1